jgi:hypothetical protein
MSTQSSVIKLPPVFASRRSLVILWVRAFSWLRWGYPHRGLSFGGPTEICVTLRNPEDPLEVRLCESYMLSVECSAAESVLRPVFWQPLRCGPWGPSGYGRRHPRASGCNPGRRSMGGTGWMWNPTCQEVGRCGIPSLSGREWTWNSTLPEVAVGWLVKSRCGCVCLDVLVSCVLFLFFFFFFFSDFCYGTDSVNPSVSDCGLGLLLGHDLSVIVKKNNSVLLSNGQACSPVHAPRATRTWQCWWRSRMWPYPRAQPAWIGPDWGLPASVVAALGWGSV